jgi:hypothetical protein
VQKRVEYVQWRLCWQRDIRIGQSPDKSVAFVGGRFIESKGIDLSHGSFPERSVVKSDERGRISPESSDQQKTLVIGVDLALREISIVYFAVLRGQVGTGDSCRDSTCITVCCRIPPSQAERHTADAAD